MPSTLPDAADSASEEAALIQAHLAAVSWIEAHLFEPMTCKSIADHAGYSPSRFSRGFTRLQGESVMAYVRGRRLEAALRRIQADPAVRLLELALDCGFDSQEAFTRAFARAFGHPPGRMRTLGPVRRMLRRRRSNSREPQIHERVELVPELHLAGIRRILTPANYSDIPNDWRRLQSMRPIEGQLGDEIYAVHFNVDARDGSVDMLAALRVCADVTPPADLTHINIPAQACVVFRHILRKGDVFPQVNAVREILWRTYLPRWSDVLLTSPPLEVFPNGLSVTPGSWIDHYFPIAEAKE